MSEATKRANEALAKAMIPKSAKEVMRGLLEDADRSQDRIRALEMILADMVGAGMRGMGYEQACQCLDKSLIGGMVK